MYIYNTNKEAVFTVAEFVICEKTPLWETTGTLDNLAKTKPKKKKNSELHRIQVMNEPDSESETGLFVVIHVLCRNEALLPLVWKYTIIRFDS